MRIAIAYISFFLLFACASNLPYGGAVPSAAENISLTIQPFDGNMMAQPVGAKRVGYSDYIIFKTNAGANVTGMMFGALGVIASHSLQASGNAKLVSGYENTFNDVKLTSLTRSLLNEQFSAQEASLRGKTGVEYKLEVTTYALMEAEENAIINRYITDVAIKNPSAEKIWRNQYVYTSNKNSIADFAKDTYTLENDARRALTANLSKMFKDFANRNNIPQRSPNSTLVR